jgi:hypothetical protein
MGKVKSIDENGNLKPDKFLSACNHIYIQEQCIAEITRFTCGSIMTKPKHDKDAWRTGYEAALIDIEFFHSFFY